MPARLGYKGFLIREGNKQELILGSETRLLQQTLLETMPIDLLLEGNIQEIKREITSGIVRVKTNGQPSMSSSSPSSNRCPASHVSQEWSLNPKARRCNNCYNYANSKRTDTFSQPGQASGYIVNKMNGPNIEAAAVSDGLVVPDPTSGPKKAVNFGTYGAHRVALVVDSGL